MTDFTINPSKKKRGRPVGTPGNGKFNCKTTVVRVPVHLKDKVVQLVNFYESIESLKTEWELKIEKASNNSKNGVPSPRYDKAMQLLQELENILNQE